VLWSLEPAQSPLDARRREEALSGPLYGFRMSRLSPKSSGLMAEHQQPRNEVHRKYGAGDEHGL
jgi:hypothetical protein